MKKKNALLTAFLSLVILFLFQGVSQASSNNNNGDLNLEIEQMKERYQKLGIDEKTGEKLIKKVLKGKLLDSQRSDISEEDVTVIDNKDGSEIIIFPDGSRVKTFVESNEPEPLIQTFGASTGTIKLSCSSSTICKATVGYYDMIWDIKYDANVNIYNGGSPGITSVSNFRHDAVMYSITSLGSAIIRSNATATSPAKARWRFIAKNKTGLYEVTRDLSVYVNKESTVYARLEWD